VVSAQKIPYPLIFIEHFNVKNTTQRQGGEERKIINPTEAVDFKDEYDYPFTQTLLYGHF
jgi:hypothetical protein